MAQEDVQDLDKGKALIRKPSPYLAAIARNKAKNKFGAKGRAIQETDQGGSDGFLLIIKDALRI